MRIFLLSNKKFCNLCLKGQHLSLCYFVLSVDITFINNNTKLVQTLDNAESSVISAAAVAAAAMKPPVIAGRDRP